LKNNLAVTDTCFSVGFESPGSFSTLFKKMTGLSPSAYLIRQQERKTSMQRAPLRFIPGCFSLQD
jgi:AraC-like DNA-binding protein